MDTSRKNSTGEGQISRRQFIRGIVAVSSGFALSRLGAMASAATGKATPPVVVFSKVYQELHLSFADAAAVTAEAGLNGIDCPVRPGGEVLPEEVADALPRYVHILRRGGLQLPLLTTAITSVASPHAETVLRTAKKLGVQCYRLGFIERQREVSSPQQVREVRAQLKDLAALNKEIGIGALLQNHSPSGRTSYFGGDLAELFEAVEDFDPAQIGVAFDIGHALVVHGDDWRSWFEKLKPHFKIAYVKDVKRAGGWVHFGQGDIAATGYFQLLRQIGYQAPVSLHVEFDWTDGGKSKTRAALVKALQESSRVLRQWLGG
ncbi:MAG TPA: TIM barrel protein [Candidatus Acidoferrum sp.]|nr:TIM barrel protein [Candidatus Acidoferrum sp.]